MYTMLVEFTGLLPVKVNTMGANKPFVLTEKSMINIMQFELMPFIKPITLTEDILLKAGFSRPKDFINGLWLTTKVVSIKKGWLQDEICVSLRYNDFKLELWTVEKIMTFDCEYLHQLQNAIYALTNEELTINL